MRPDGRHSISTRLAPTGPPVCQKGCTGAGPHLICSIPPAAGRGKSQAKSRLQEIEGAHAPGITRGGQAAGHVLESVLEQRDLVHAALSLISPSHLANGTTAASLSGLFGRHLRSSARSLEPLRHRRGTLLWGGAKTCRDRHPMQRVLHPNASSAVHSRLVRRVGPLQPVTACPALSAPRVAAT
jgi:hypothetical protein